MSYNSIKEYMRAETPVLYAKVIDFGMTDDDDLSKLANAIVAITGVPVDYDDEVTVVLQRAEMALKNNVN